MTRRDNMISIYRIQKNFLKLKQPGNLREILACDPSLNSSVILLLFFFFFSVSTASSSALISFYPLSGLNVTSYFKCKHWFSKNKKTDHLLRLEEKAGIPREEAKMEACDEMASSLFRKVPMCLIQTLALSTFQKTYSVLVYQRVDLV